METKPMLKSWGYAENQKIILEYTDGDTILICKADFERNFGAIAGASKDEVISLKKTRDV